MANNIKKTLILVSLSLAFLIVGNVSASVKSVTGQLSLMATVDGKPAFRPVLWRLKHAKKRVYEKTLHKHTATLDLEPGTYLVSLSYNNKTITRQVMIKESHTEKLIISLD